jgi:hypothetical protein
MREAVVPGDLIAIGDGLSVPFQWTSRQLGEAPCGTPPASLSADFSAAPGTAV